MSATWKHTGISWDEPLVQRVSEFWLYWNQIIEPQADWRVRIEDYVDRWPEVLERLGLEPSAFPTGIDPMLGKIQKPRVELTWSDLGPCEGLIRKKAREYGYDVPL